MTNIAKWRKWVIGGALVLACAEGAALSQWKSHSKYLRYVSKPLSDGTRCTFLYPARLSKMSEDKTHISIVSAPQVPTLRDEALLRLGWPKDQIVHEGYGNELSAYCYPDVIPPPKRGHFKRWFGYEHVLVLENAPSHHVFYMRHERFREDNNTFQQDDKVLSDSFQILPPGAPVPS